MSNFKATSALHYFPFRYFSFIENIRKLIMTRPETPFEAASYDLKKFRERRMAERRSILRDSADRRMPGAEPETEERDLDSDADKN
jgi:hypothetical protein